MADADSQNDTLADGMCRGVALALFGSIALAGARVSASPQDLWGFGPRSIAMGATGVSYTDDLSAAYVNPAGLSRARAAAVTFGYDAAGFDLWQRVGNGSAQALPLERAHSFLFGAVVPIPLPGWFDDRVAFGFGADLPIDVIGRNQVSRPETPQFLLLENRTQAIALSGGLGIRLPFGFRIGGGAAAMAALGGAITVGSDSTGTLTYSIDDRITIDYAPMVGASWERGPIRLGATWRAALVGQLDVVVIASGLGLPLPPFQVSGVPQYDPWQVAFEAAYVDHGWTVAAGVTFKRWSEYPGPLSATTNGSPAIPPTEFHDTFVARAGVEHRWGFAHSGVIARAGYFFEQSPIPAQTQASNYLDNDRHVGTLGLALWGRMRGTTLTVDVYGQMHFLVTDTSTKDSTVAADNPGVPSISSGGTMYFVGTAVTVSL